MSLDLPKGGIDLGRFPRTRGDEPDPNALFVITAGFSPHARG